MHVLLINPNTRADLTAELLLQMRPHLQGTGVSVMGQTAPFGEAYIASEQSYVVAAHAVLDAWHAHVIEHGRPLAVLVACFGDPAVWALREVAGVPVTGLAEAAMREALALGPFAIVTGGHAWGPMLDRLARCLKLAGTEGLQRVHTVQATGGELAAQPEAGAALLGQACAQVLADCEAAQRPVRSVIVGGAALGAWAERLRPQPACPVIDNVAAGGRWLRAQADAALGTGLSPAC